MKSLIGLMENTGGRALRIILGAAMIAVGLSLVGGVVGTILAIAGLLPIAMGVWGPCLLGFVFKQPSAA